MTWHSNLKELTKILEFSFYDSSPHNVYSAVYYDAVYIGQHILNTVQYITFANAVPSKKWWDQRLVKSKSIFENKNSNKKSQQYLDIIKLLEVKSILFSKDYTVSICPLKTSQDIL